jgi:hypothetical protein
MKVSRIIQHSENNTRILSLQPNRKTTVKFSRNSSENGFMPMGRAVKE